MQQRQMGCRRVGAFDAQILAEGLDSEARDGWAGKLGREIGELRRGAGAICDQHWPRTSPIRSLSQPAGSNLITSGQRERLLQRRFQRGPWGSLAVTGGTAGLGLSAALQSSRPRLRSKFHSTPDSRTRPLTSSPRCRSRLGRQGTSWKPSPSSIMAKRPEARVMRFR